VKGLGQNVGKLKIYSNMNELDTWGTRICFYDKISNKMTIYLNIFGPLMKYLILSYMHCRLTIAI
jgi:hypothetical protein